MMKKSLVVTFGMFLLGIGINFVLAANIGADAVTTATMGIYNLIGVISFGTAQIIFAVVFVSAGFFLDRTKIAFGTVIATFATGFFVDLFQPLLIQLLPGDPGFPVRLLIFLIGTGINGIAIGIYLSAEFGVGAGEILAVIISEKQNWRFGSVKIGSDLVMLGFGLLCGAVIGIGTVISAFMMGPVVQSVMPVAKKYFNFNHPAFIKNNY